MALPPLNQRHQYLRYEGLQYTDADIADFETRLAGIYRREIHRVQNKDWQKEIGNGGGESMIWKFQHGESTE
ncbi:hypothetical protein Tco_0312759 [Tanacetum coccineum]